MVGWIRKASWKQRRCSPQCPSHMNLPVPVTAAGSLVECHPSSLHDPLLPRRHPLVRTQHGGCQPTRVQRSEEGRAWRPRPARPAAPRPGGYSRAFLPRGEAGPGSYRDPASGATRAPRALASVGPGGPRSHFPQPALPSSAPSLQPAASSRDPQAAPK